MPRLACLCWYTTSMQNVCIKDKNESFKWTFYELLFVCSQYFVLKIFSKSTKEDDINQVCDFTLFREALKSNQECVVDS